MKYTVISTFAGCGGSSLGYKYAGFKELLAIEWDKKASDLFKLNFPEIPIWQKDICKIKSKDILTFCNIKKGELDIFDGSPPCQGFSTAGKRKVNDLRNNLFKEYVRLINELQPKVFIMENVSGMIKGKMKGLFIEIMETLKALNYNIKVKLMNSKYYNVPQSRERLIFIGIREDLNLNPSFPKPINKILNTKTVLKNIDIGNMTKEINNKFILSILNKLKPGESAGKYHKKGSYFNTCRAYYNRPCQTITKTVNLLHPVENRYLSINECKILCSFPINWELGNNFTIAWGRLGNSVMPLFMKAISENIRINVLDKHYKQLN